MNHASLGAWFILINQANSNEFPQMLHNTVIILLQVVTQATVVLSAIKIFKCKKSYYQTKDYMLVSCLFLKAYQIIFLRLCKL